MIGSLILLQLRRLLGKGEGVRGLGSWRRVGAVAERGGGVGGLTRGQGEQEGFGWPLEASNKIIACLTNPKLV